MSNIRHVQKVAQRHRRCPLFHRKKRNCFHGLFVVSWLYYMSTSLISSVKSVIFEYFVHVHPPFPMKKRGPFVKKTTKNRLERER